MRRTRDYIRATRNRRDKFKGFASGFELKGANFLREHGVPVVYEKTTLEYIKVHEYTPDFTLPDGSYLEFKGKFTSEDRRKHQLIQQQHPDIKIKFLFMRDNYLYRGSKNRYSDWCIKNGFTFAINSQGEIPLKWLEKEDGNEG